MAHFSALFQLFELKYTQYNDTQYNDTQYNDALPNDTQHNGTQHNKKNMTLSIMTHFSTLFQLFELKYIHSA